MGKTIEILAMALGGFSLFSVCVLGFAVMTGRPLDQIPVLGPALESDVEIPAVDPTEEEAPSMPRSTRSQTEVVQAGLGVLHAYDLPSPYTPGELKEIADEIKALRVRLEAQDAELDRRETELDDRGAALGEQAEALLSLRATLEEFEGELDLREQEVRRDEAAADERQRNRWREVGKVLGTLEPSQAVTRLMKYSAEDAAQILDSLDEKKVQSIMALVPEDEWKEYADAYAQVSSERYQSP